MIDLNKIYYEDHLTTLAAMPNKSVQLVVTSPPYDGLRDYDGYAFDFILLAVQLTRVLADGGIIAWNVSDQTVNGSETLTSCKQKIFFNEICGLKIHDTMIYQKRNFSHPEKNRYHNVFEYVFIFSKGKPKTFNPIMDRRNLTAGQIGNLGANTFTKKNGSKSVRTKKLIQEFGMRHNVWLGNTRGQEDMCVTLSHPAMMPKWLAADLIKSFSNEGDVVYDPCAGSGTVCEQAEILNRQWLGSEISSDYAK